MSSQLLAAVTAYIEARGGGQGLFPTPVDGVNIVRSCRTMMPMRQLYRPSLCLVLQGAKELFFGTEKIDYKAGEFLVVSIDLPASGRIAQANEQAPFIGITVDINVAMMREVLEQMDAPPAVTADPGPCIFVGRLDDTLTDGILRLIRLSQTPKAIPILYPSIMREICYWLLSGPHGGELRKLALPGSTTERVAKAISLLHTRFATPLRVEQLAAAARMSPSSFHQHFKALTALTPLQFQKRLRLLEARRLMMAEAANVAAAAYQVGYESPSQFSRDYCRMFGMAPKRDAMLQQRLHHEYARRKAPAV